MHLSSTTDRTIQAGQVVCPVRGSVDIERCFACPGFVGIREGWDERVVCDADRDPTTVALRLAEARGMDQEPDLA